MRCHTKSGADPVWAISTPKSYESNFIYHDFLQFRK